MLDRFPQSALTAAAATQAVIVLGLYSAGPDPAAAVAFLLLMGGALKPVFITTPNAMLHCAPGRTKKSYWQPTPVHTTPTWRRAPRSGH
ncbi:hypothetical protein ABZ667_34895 [Streptomyces lavendulae]|uniref:hypothetical protein n=1 Tax=Streptomyces lavendulae TaxID=1914 RepID=UPI0033D5EBB7